MSALLNGAISRTAVLDLKLARGLPSIDVDLGQFRQVMVTLVTNSSDALGATPGSIRVTTGRQLIDEAFLAQCTPGTVAQPGPFVFVEVRDTGSGMDARTLQHMFEPFFSTKFTGRGLGLAAVLGIMRSHRGAIHVQSDLGVGTTVTVFFPARDDEAVSPSSRALPSD
jgi:two-component system cell cycle sensor histidine kinase/response regulator CckA